jgi:hypothetical protein
MTDPYPEARRRARLDRTDHQRARRDRGRQRRGPSTSRIEAALETVANHDIPGTPGTGDLRVLKHVHDSEWTVETREVRDFSVTRGDPQHGAKRSDDHVGRYTVAFPLFEADLSGVPEECPECGGERGVYTYRAHHYISGGESVTCLRCEQQLHSEEWG